MKHPLCTVETHQTEYKVPLLILQLRKILSY